MSGGSYGYIYSSMINYCKNEMYDDVMNEIIDDLIPLLKALEWWKSCDWGEDKYRECVKAFKEKWINNSKGQEEALNKLVDEFELRLERIKNENKY